MKVLHVVENAKAREIWRAAADRYEKSHPGETVDFMKFWMTKDVQRDLAASGLLSRDTGSGRRDSTPLPTTLLLSTAFHSGWAVVGKPPPLQLTR